MGSRDTAKRWRADILAWSIFPAWSTGVLDIQVGAGAKFKTCSSLALSYAKVSRKTAPKASQRIFLIVRMAGSEGGVIVATQMLLRGRRHVCRVFHYDRSN